MICGGFHKKGGPKIEQIYYAPHDRDYQSGAPSFWKQPYTSQRVQVPNIEGPWFLTCWVLGPSGIHGPVRVSKILALGSMHVSVHRFSASGFALSFPAVLRRNRSHIQNGRRF